MSAKRDRLKALVLAITVLAVPGLAPAEESGTGIVLDEKDIEKRVEKKSYSPVGGRALSLRLDQSDVTDEPSSADRDSLGEDDAGWSFQLAAYGWMAGAKADVGVGPIESSGEADFIDLARKLDIGGMLHFEGRKKRWGFMLDGLYMSLSDDATVRAANFRLRGINIEGGVEMALLEATAFYRFGDAGLSFDRFEKKGLSFDALVGVRALFVDVEIELGPLSTFSRDKWLVDPIIGGRFHMGLSERWLLSLRGDIGGFGVGSDLTWNAWASLGYRLSERATLAFGYRHLAIDYSSGNLELDLEFSGPFLGMSFRF
jgi:hypothetical protein